MSTKTGSGGGDGEDRKLLVNKLTFSRSIEPHESRKGKSSPPIVMYELISRYTQISNLFNQSSPIMVCIHATHATKDNLTFLIWPVL